MSNFDCKITRQIINQQTILKWTNNFWHIFLLLHIAHYINYIFFARFLFTYIPKKQSIYILKNITFQLLNIPKHCTSWSHFSLRFCVYCIKNTINLLLILTKNETVFYALKSTNGKERKKKMQMHQKRVLHQTFAYRFNENPHNGWNRSLCSWISS